MNFQVEHDHHFHSFSPCWSHLFGCCWQPWTFGQCLESIQGLDFQWSRSGAGVLALLCLCFLLRWSHLLCGAADQTFCEGKPTRGSPEGGDWHRDWSTGRLVMTAIMKQDGTGATSHQVIKSPWRLVFWLDVFLGVQWNLRRFLCSIFFRDIMRYPWRYPPVTNCRAGTSQRIFHGELVQSPYHLKHHQKIWLFGESYGGFQKWGYPLTHPIHPYDMAMDQ